MPMSTSDIRQLLVPGLAAIQGSDYNDYPAQWTEIYKVYPSDKFQEVVQEIRLLAPGQLKTQGNSIAFDNNLGTRATANYYIKTFSIGYAMTEESVEDNLYQSYFPLANKAMKSSLDATKETVAAALFNNGWDTNFPVYDGQPLFSAAGGAGGATGHPFDGGFIDNTFQNPLGLSEAAIESAITGINYFKSPSGIYTKIKPLKLIVNQQNQWIAERILGSQFMPGNANNDVNPLYSTNAIPQGYKMNIYLQQVNGGNPWFIVTDCEGLRHFVRKPLTIDAYADFNTKNLLVSALERYAMGCDNFRTVFGSYGN